MEINKKKELVFESFLNIRCEEIFEKDITNMEEEYSSIKKNYTLKEKDKTISSDEIVKILANIKQRMYELKNHISYMIKKREYYHLNRIDMVSFIEKDIITIYNYDYICNSDELEYLIRESIDHYFTNNKQFDEYLKLDIDDFKEAFENVYYVSLNSNNEHENTQGRFEPEEQQIVINQYYTNVNEKLRNQYPPHCIKAVFVINDYDDIKYIFKKDKTINTFFNTSDEAKIRRALKKEESILYGYADIFEIEPENIYRFPSALKTDDNRLKCYFLINNIDQWLIKLEDNISEISIPDDEEHFYNDDYDHNDEYKNLSDETDKIISELSDDDIGKLIEITQQTIRGYENCIHDYKLSHIDVEQTKNYDQNEYTMINDIDLIKNEEDMHNVENNYFNKEVIFLDNIVICHMTPQMYYLKMDNDLKGVLGVKSYDILEFQGRKYIELKDNYYTIYKTVKKNEKISFSTSRDTASIETLRQLFDIEFLNLK